MKAILSVLAVLAVVAGFGYVGHMEHSYTRKRCEVVAIEGNEVVVLDEAGHEWSFIGEGYKLGEVVTLEMFDNCTSSIYDDEVIEVKRMEQ